jgi:hypothetical protein
LIPRGHGSARPLYDWALLLERGGEGEERETAVREIVPMSPWLRETATADGARENNAREREAIRVQR